jgi:hypothetical protein
MTSCAGFPDGIFTWHKAAGGEGKQALFIVHHPIEINRQSAFKSHLLASGGVFEGNREINYLKAN